jgi:hypothetical protein
MVSDDGWWTDTETAQFVDRQRWAAAVWARNGELERAYALSRVETPCPPRRGDPVDASTAAATASAVIAVLALGFGFIQYRERRRQQLLIDLQGGKEAVAAVATRVRHGELPWRQQHRRELLEAMCLTAVFERSGRSRSLIYAALVKAMIREESRKEIISSVEDISAIITRNSPYTDLARARRLLFALRAALSMNDDLRIRVERIDAYLSQPDDTAKFDKRCTDEIHTWGVLKKVLEQRKSVVLVCPRPTADGDTLGCPTIALDFHKTARILKQHAPGVSGSAIAHSQSQLPISRDERFRLTELGQRLRSAKYGQSIADLNLIADELAKVIANHLIYTNIYVIVVVPGREHDFSDQLGKEVARRASKLCVPIIRSDVNVGSLVLIDSSSVKGRDVILLDDVYRTGDTLRDAAQVVRRAGARQVFGLTATSTVSAIAPHCGNH